MKDYWLVVADDDVFCLKNIKQILDEEKIRASIVRSGTALLKFLENNEPDLILLDVMMPEMSGFETLCRIRENEVKENRRQIPVIFMTGENDTESEYKARELGASDFIRKPTERSILLMRIQNTISKNKTIENLTEEAVTDHLTGLYNRAGAESRVAEFCQNGGGMLLILDLDNFKPINDIYGNDAGDRVLKLFAE
ncbi:MAG: response regulator, partial [Firmicutes bacterium]|nr:response regulator [Bacillota bacterium]